MARRRFSRSWPPYPDRVAFPIIARVCLAEGAVATLCLVAVSSVRLAAQARSLEPGGTPWPGVQGTGRASPRYPRDAAAPRLRRPRRWPRGLGASRVSRVSMQPTFDRSGVRRYTGMRGVGGELSACQAAGEVGMDDGFELEVTDLRTGAPLPSPLTPASASASAATTVPSQPDTEGADTLELTVESLRSADLRPQLPLPFLPRDRARRLGGALAGGVTILVFAALLLSLPGIQRSLGALLRPATPTPTEPLSVGADRLYFANSVPWGVLQVDGRTTGVPTLDQGPLTLARGRHILDYRAEPFRRFRCTVSVPAADSDTCPLHRDILDSSDLTANARVIDLGATVEALPDDQRFDLTRVVGSALASITGSATVAPGDHYLGTGGAIAVATVSLSVALNFSLNTDPTRASFSVSLPPDCITLCASDLNSSTPDGGWDVQAHALLRWTFIDAQGAISVADDIDIARNLSVRWDGSWSVAVEDSGDMCELAFERLPTPQGVEGYSAAGTNSAPNLADGCLITLQHDSGTGTPTPVTALLLYRVGVLLATNAAAQQLFPSLTVASAHERALAQQWQLSG